MMSYKALIELHLFAVGYIMQALRLQGTITVQGKTAQGRYFEIVHRVPPRSRKNE